MTNSTAGTASVQNWKEQKDKLKAKFSTLTDADLHYEDGKKEEMMEKLHIKLGKTPEEMKEILSSL